MIYTLEQIKELAEPIAKKYQLNALWVFGSYARGEATDDSDVDLLMDYTDSIAINLHGFIDIEYDFEQTFNKDVDIISTDALYGPLSKTYFLKFMNIVTNEIIKLYEK
jgi:predicted nucleotidyltransferase